MALSLHHGERIVLDKVGGFADGVAVKVVGEETFRICRELLDGIVLVSRDAICASIKVRVWFVFLCKFRSFTYGLNVCRIVLKFHFTIKVVKITQTDVRPNIQGCVISDMNFSVL